MSGQVNGRRLRRVILESPFKGDAPAVVFRNVQYARVALRDCALRGESAMVSHLLWTQPGVLDDSVPDERALGIECGLAWGGVAEATVVYVDHGISRGMLMGIERAKLEGRPVEYRRLLRTDAPAGGETLDFGRPFQCADCAAEASQIKDCERCQRNCPTGATSLTQGGCLYAWDAGAREWRRAGMLRRNRMLDA